MLWTSFLLRGARTLGVCAAVMLAQQTPAHADVTDSDLFIDFLQAGCLGSVAAGYPIDVYAQGAQLAPAPTYLAAAFLRGRPGSAYMKATPRTVLIIAQSNAGTCTVATRMVSGMDALRTSVEAALTDPKVSFTFVQETQRALENNAVEKTRQYDGAINQRPYGAIFSSAENGPAPQAVLTLFRKDR